MVNSMHKKIPTLSIAKGRGYLWYLYSLKLTCLTLKYSSLYLKHIVPNIKQRLWLIAAPTNSKVDTAT